MPVKSELMNTITTRTICQLTPMAALPVNPTMLPTMAWSMIPCSPAMTFCSIVGQAIFHTAAPIGPSIIVRSNLRCALGASATKVLGLWGAGTAVRWEFTTRVPSRAFTPAGLGRSRASAQNVTEPREPKAIGAIGQKAGGEIRRREVVHSRKARAPHRGDELWRIEKSDERLAHPRQAPGQHLEPDALQDADRRGPNAVNEHQPAATRRQRRDHIDRTQRRRGHEIHRHAEPQDELGSAPTETRLDEH